MKPSPLIANPNYRNRTANKGLFHFSMRDLNIEPIVFSFYVVRCCRRPFYSSMQVHHHNLEYNLHL